MRKIFTLVISILPLLYSSTAFCLTLEDAITKAYENNPELKSYQQEYIREIQQYPEAFSEGFLPDVSIQASSSKIRQPSQIQGHASKGSNLQGSFNIVQNLFAGWAGIHGLSAASKAVEAAKLDYLAKEQKFIQDAVKTYIDFIVASEKFESTKSFVNSARNEYEASLERKKVGEVTKSEVATAKAQLSEALASHSANRAAMKTTENKFTEFFGINPGEIHMPDLPKDLPSSFDEFKDFALGNNLIVKRQFMQLLSLRSKSKASYAGLLPKLNARFTKSNKIDESHETVRKTEEHASYTTSLELSVPILPRGGSEYSKIRRAKSEYRRNVAVLENIKRQINTQLIQTWENFIAAKDASEFSKEAVEARKLAYDSTKSAYEVGLKTMLEVLKAEKELFEAVARNIQHRENYIKAAYDIKSELAQLTAKEMHLHAKLFDPDQELRKTKFKLLGF